MVCFFVFQDESLWGVSLEMKVGEHDGNGRDFTGKCRHLAQESKGWTCPYPAFTPAGLGFVSLGMICEL